MSALSTSMLSPSPICRLRRATLPCCCGWRNSVTNLSNGDAIRTSETKRRWSRMTRIHWADLSPDTYESFVACLLNHLNPDYRRINGAGGDGGRDVQFELPDGLHVFDLKSFSGRMTPGRRKQAEQSLR